LEDSNEGENLKDILQKKSTEILAGNMVAMVVKQDLNQEILKHM